MGKFTGRGLNEMAEQRPSLADYAIDSRAYSCVEKSGRDRSSLLARLGALRRGVAGGGSDSEAVSGSTSALADRSRSTTGKTGAPRFDVVSEFDKKYVRCELLGEGESGVVYVVRPRAAGPESKELYACKEIKLNPTAGGKESSATILQVMKELRLLKSLRHPNLVELHDYFIDGDHCRLVMSLLSGGALTATLADHGSLPEEDARGIMTGVLRGIQHMHEKGIAHRDLKLDNVVLLDEFSTSEVKVIDFGLAKQVAQLHNDYAGCDEHTTCGSPLYIAPEVATPVMEAEDGKVFSCYGVEADMWSCGVMLYILLAGHPPFDTESGLYKLFQQVRGGKYSLHRDPVWELISDGAKDLVTKMLTVNPKQRITAAEALRHPWLLE